jgi:formylglycine-generating enzyme required for sulfatase activity/energy-coupling factor transporter ATP-binding protein EcfA2
MSIPFPVGPQNPFIGIRSFEPAESLLFHGRKEHTQQLLRVLAAHRLVSVVGTSGSGKSSLVKAGLLPALYRGYLRGATSRWRTATMRPGPAPLQRLAEALCQASPIPVAAGTPAELAQRLAAHSAALADEVRAGNLDRERENLLLVVDQFEELFTSAEPQDAAFFVALLLRAAQEFEVPLYIVLTMRSEFLGECTRFPGLAQVMSEAQYLVPRLTREQLEEAIRGPLDMVGEPIEDALVQQLLNDAGNDPDQLPALQHALMRLYARRQPGSGLTLPLYRAHVAELGVGRSVNTHAEELLTSDTLQPVPAGLPERVFRCLTRRDEGGRDLRRPARLSHLCAVTEASTEEVRTVVRAFGAPEQALLTITDQQSGDPWIDITHETLIRQWDRLRDWVRDEAASAAWFRRVVQSTLLRELGQAGLWRDPDVSSAFKFSRGWNVVWARQYVPDPAYEIGIAFLEASREKIQSEEALSRQQTELLEIARQREISALTRQRRGLITFLAVILAVSGGLVYFAVEWRKERQNVAELLDRLNRASGSAKVNPRDNLIYVSIPPGEFIMGCSASDEECDEDEKPPHRVRITKGFWLGQTEVTQAAYQKVTGGKDPSSFKGSQRPVETVSWDEAGSYCNAIGMRLPTEAEWEYAARAGTTVARYGALDNIAWYGGNSGSETKPVGTREPNAWGLFDLLGNVWEWTADSYKADYYGKSPVDDPRGPEGDGLRVLRGGSWDYLPEIVRVSNRVRYEPTYRFNNIGFRCAGELP